MADALPGAPAPAPLAVPADSLSLHSPCAAAPLVDQPVPAADRVPDAAELPRLVRDALRQCGYGDGHALAVGLADLVTRLKLAEGQARAEQERFETTCETMARTASGVLDLIDEQDAMPHRLPLRAAVAQMGWLADELVNRLGSGYVKGGAAVWMLHAQEIATFQAQGGAA